jgi:alpha-1,6-mannosyltransferase
VVHALLDREAPDVIEASSPWAGGVFVARYRPPGARGSSVRKSFVFHQDPVAVYPQTWLGGYLGEARVDALFTPFWRYLRALSRRFDWTVVGGQWLAARLAGQGVHNPTAVPFGVDRAAFHGVRPDPQLRAALLARCGASPDAALLLCVSRLHPEKRLTTLLRALPLVAAKRPVALVIFGDGPFAKSLARKARGLPVCFAGYTRDRAQLAAALASADALVHGGAAETFGLVIAEALAAGLPVVVPDRGGAADFARGAHAELYPAGDARACAYAIERMQTRDREQLRALSVAAAARLVRSQHEHFEQLFALYAEPSVKQRQLRRDTEQQPVTIAAAQESD